MRSDRFLICQKCITAHETCSYDKFIVSSTGSVVTMLIGDAIRRPSVAFAVALQRQLKAYEDRFQQLRTANESERSSLLSNSSSC